MAREATRPPEPVMEVRAVPGRGLEGDRYFFGTGTYSRHPGSGRDVTLIEAEAIEAIAREAGIALPPGASRRNIVTRGVPLNHLVGRRFHLGECLVEATRLSVPCRHIEEILGKAVFDPMVHRSGLNCRILKGGTLRLGDAIRPA